MALVSTNLATISAEAESLIAVSFYNFLQQRTGERISMDICLLQKGLYGYPPLRIQGNANFLRTMTQNVAEKLTELDRVVSHRSYSVAIRTRQAGGFKSWFTLLSLITIGEI